MGPSRFFGKEMSVVRIRGFPLTADGAAARAFGAVRAIASAWLALHGDGCHLVSLDSVMATMRQTGADLQSKYKETSVGARSELRRMLECQPPRNALALTIRSHINVKNSLALLCFRC
jgi:hypothetical protein